MPLLFHWVLRWGSKSTYSSWGSENDAPKWRPLYEAKFVFYFLLPYCLLPLILPHSKPYKLECLFPKESRRNQNPCLLKVDIKSKHYSNFPLPFCVRADHKEILWSALEVGHTIPIPARILSHTQGEEVLSGETKKNLNRQALLGFPTQLFPLESTTPALRVLYLSTIPIHWE